MELSKRALDFLQQSERELSKLTEQDILDAFSANDAPIFKPLIDFQLKYGGYIFYAGLAPIKFSLLQGQGGFPNQTKTSIIQFEEDRYNLTEISIRLCYDELPNAVYIR
jgi:hypothetical protein